MASLKVYLFGIKRFERLLPGALSDDSVQVQVKEPWACDALYVVYGTHLLSRWGILLFLMFWLRRRRIFVHWIGTDVLEVLRPGLKPERIGMRNVRRVLWRLIKRVKVIQHLAGAQHLREELLGMGLRNIKYLPIPGERFELAVQPLPDRPAVLSYIPEEREKFYGLPTVLELARQNPDVEFHIVAHSGHEINAPANMRFYGWVDKETMCQLYDASSCVVRLAEHDALGGTVIEGVGRGRFAIWSYPAPYAYLAKSFEEAQAALQDIKTMGSPNFEGAAFISKHFDHQHLVEVLRQELLSNSAPI